MQHSQYHIDDWLTDYECLTDLEAVNDVLVLSPLFKGYTGEGVTKDEWGMRRVPVQRIAQRLRRWRRMDRTEPDVPRFQISTHG